MPSEKLQQWAEALELDPREFAIKIMEYCDPHSYKLIYGSNRSD